MSTSGTDLFDSGVVARFLDAHGIGSGPLRAERLGDGHSNITYLVERDGATVVVRRPPRPPLPPSAHDVVREAAIVAALHAAGARVPRILAVCDEPLLSGVPFSVMERVSGVPLDTALPAAIDEPGSRAALGRDVIAALVEIHAIEPETCGLAGFGRPDGYLERQVRRFRGLWEVNRTRDLPVVVEIADWLDANRPVSATPTVVHGDYRVGNLLVAEDAPARVTAILDWELATIGDPLADLGYLASTYAEADDPEPVAAVRLSPVTRLPGFPPRRELVAAYARLSGRETGALGWYECLAHWKSAIFCENMYKRYLAGDRSDAFAVAMEQGVPARLELAWAMTR